MKYSIYCTYSSKNFVSFWYKYNWGVHFLKCNRTMNSTIHRSKHGSCVSFNCQGHIGLSLVRVEPKER